MPSPFPGMDPYLESTGWTGLHHLLLTGLVRALQPQVNPVYWVTVEQRVYERVPDDLVIVGVPDVTVTRNLEPALPPSGSVATISRYVEVVVPKPETVREKYLEIRDTRSSEVVTVIELLSPSNKRRGVGREEYLRKRERILASYTNLVEIDLLRGDERMPILRAPEHYDYGVLVCPSRSPDYSRLYPFMVREPLPSFLVPLRPEEEPVYVDLGAVFAQVYDDGGFATVVDYAAPPNPPLSPEDAAWADALLREKGLR